MTEPRKEELTKEVDRSGQQELTPSLCPGPAEPSQRLRAPPPRQRHPGVSTTTGA